MLIERPVSVAATLFGAAMIFPQSFRLISEYLPVMSLSRFITGALAGGVGVYLGCAVAASCTDRRSQSIRLWAWVAAGMFLSAGIGIGVLFAPQWTHKVILLAAALLPLVGPVVTRR